MPQKRRPNREDTDTREAATPHPNEDTRRRDDDPEMTAAGRESDQDIDVDEDDEFDEDDDEGLDEEDAEDMKDE
jgi:hypothetical protein